MSAQSMRALDLARQTRSDRKAITAELLAGRLSLEEAMSAECCWSLPVGRLLEFLSWWGPVRAKRLLGPLGVEFDLEVGRLTDRQRSLVAVAYRREMARMSTGRRSRRA